MRWWEVGHVYLFLLCTISMSECEVCNETNEVSFNQGSLYILRHKFKLLSRKKSPTFSKLGWANIIGLVKSSLCQI